jgi:hypothetical protein
MTNPITPPPELLDQWCITGKSGNLHNALTLAYRAGADQELEACCKWLPKLPPWSADDLRRHRRPNPPSLKEQALAAQQRMWDGTSNHDDWNLIRRALEQLPDAHYSPRTGGPR